VRNTRRIPLLIVGLVCGTVAILYLAQAVSGPARTELYADQGQLRLTIAKVGKETDFLLPSVQEQIANQPQAQRAAPARFRPGESYFVVRGFIEDRTGQALSQRLTVGPTEVSDDAGRKQAAVHVTYSALRNEPSLTRLYEPPAQGPVVQQQRFRRDLWLSNAANIRGAVNVAPTTADAFLPAHLRAFVAFFRPLHPDAKRIDFRHTALEAQEQHSEDVRFDDVTAAAVPQEKLAAGYRVAIDSLQLVPQPTSEFARPAASVQSLLAAGKDHELLISLRIVPAREDGVLPPNIGFAPPLVEDDMGDRVVCQQVRAVLWPDAASTETAKKAKSARGEWRELWRAAFIDPKAKRFTITTRLSAAGPPAKREFLIRGIPVP